MKEIGENFYSVEIKFSLHLKDSTLNNDSSIRFKKVMKIFQHVGVANEDSGT